MPLNRTDQGGATIAIILELPLGEGPGIRWSRRIAARRRYLAARIRQFLLCRSEDTSGVEGVGLFIHHLLAACRLRAWSNRPAPVRCEQLVGPRANLSSNNRSKWYSRWTVRDGLRVRISHDLPHGAGPPRNHGWRSRSRSIRSKWRSCGSLHETARKQDGEGYFDIADRDGNS